MMIYLDNGASSFPKPKIVSKSMAEAVRKYGANPGRSGHFLSEKASLKIYEARCEIADLFGAEPENVVFTQSCTHSINIALKGYLKEGDEVLVSDMEHNAVLRPLYKLREKNIIYKEIETNLYDDNETIENFSKAITEKTKLIAVTSCSNVIGKIMPIAKLGKLCKNSNIKFLVDGAQLAGIVDIKLNRDNINFLALAGHKSLLGPQGVGILIIKDEETLDTLYEGGTGTNSKSLEMPSDMPERLEAGTISLPAIVGLLESVKYIKRIGLEKIYEHEQKIIKYAYNELKKIGATLYTKEPDETFVGVISFNIKGKLPNEVGSFLDRYKILTRSGYHCAYSAHKKIGSEENGTVRIGISKYNTKNQIDILIKVLKKLKY